MLQILTLVRRGERRRDFALYIAIKWRVDIFPIQMMRRRMWVPYISQTGAKLHTSN